MERPVWAVGVVVREVLLQHCREVARSGDQEVVEALAARGVAMKRSAIAFARGARIGVRIARMSAPATTASKAAVNLLSPGRGSRTETGRRGHRGP